MFTRPTFQSLVLIHYLYSGRHEAYYKSIGPQTIKIPASEGDSAETIVQFVDGELVNIEVSHKVRSIVYH